jgi:hypothetical protein
VALLGTIIAGFGSESHLVWPNCPVQGISVSPGHLFKEDGEERSQLHTMIVNFFHHYTGGGNTVNVWSLFSYRIFSYYFIVLSSIMESV